MLWPSVEPTTMRRAQHHGHMTAATEHEARLRRLVDQRIHGQRDEIHEHDLDHRLESAHRRPHGHGGDGGLGDRCVAHPLGAECFQQPPRHLERSACLCHIFTKHDDVVIRLHCVAQRGVGGLKVFHFHGG
ncbi:hypothetical protein SDC9_174811 [bioreactor metagenome]|uniref:Uncharacterized protein n=1 Tax=bioreactor metagenome TaxID=1076179 RepID=A0A645GMH8_9ZZZZ